MTEECRVSQVVAEVKPRGEWCRESTRQAVMNDSAGQQRLHATEQRVSPAGETPSVATRVEPAQEGPDEAMRQALAASSARNVRPRTAETSSRMEEVLPSRKRGSEEVGLLDDPRLTPADESQMGISEMAVILMSLSVLFCRNSLGDAAVAKGIGRGFAVDEEQMEEVEQPVRDEEPLLLICSPVCEAFISAFRLSCRPSQ